MAKQISMIKFTGKLGEMVGQKDAYGKAIIRQRVESPKNPKTTAQAGQRYKLLPAQRIASALKEIIERGQQGVKYGLESRNLFMKRALKMTTGFPYMEKDDPNIIPGEYQLTKGTLPEVKVDTFGANGRNITFTLLCPSETDFNTVGSFSASLLGANSGIQEGDQITIVIFALDNGVIVSKYQSMIIDTTSQESEFLNFGGLGSIFSNNERLGLEDGNFLAGACIISRPNGANGYLRSNATLAVDKTNALISKYFSATGQSDALKTYEGDTSISNNTNWPVDVDGDGGASGGGGGSSVERGLYTLTAADCEAGASGPVGSKILVGMVNGVIKNIYYVVDDDVRCCCDLAGDVVMHTYGEDTLAVTFATLSEAFLTGKNPVAY